MRYHLALLIIAAAAFSAAATMLPPSQSTPLPVWTPLAASECNRFASQVRRYWPKLGNSEQCFKKKDFEQFVFQSTVNTSQGVIPITVGFNSSNIDIIERSIVVISGGPGGKISSEFPSPATFQIAQNCSAIVVSPIYSGSYERSHFPNPSQYAAEKEVGAVINSLTGEGLKINIIANSLGGHIFSSEFVPIPEGRHLLISPMIVSPEKIIGFFGTNPSAAFTWNKRIITTPNGPHEESVKLFDFQSGYFAKEKTNFEDDFFARWNKKDNISGQSYVHVILAENEDRAGGMEYFKKLTQLGFSVESVSGGHSGSSQAERAERERKIADYGSKVCDSFQSTH